MGIGLHGVLSEGNLEKFEKNSKIDAALWTTEGLDNILYKLVYL